MKVVLINPPEMIAGEQGGTGFGQRSFVKQLRVLPPLGLALRFAARVLTASHTRIGPEPPPAHRAGSLPGLRHADSSSPRRNQPLRWFTYSRLGSFLVSRGGAFLVEWMIYNEEENPLYAQFDRLLEIAREFDAVISLGDGLRPGCLADATDRSQVQELILLGELAEQAQKFGVQTMIEGPGHVPLNEIETNIMLEKKLCNGAPFYVLGPITTDIAPGYDHITAAIGGAIAGKAGADFLCYVTPAEHLCLPTAEDVRQGVIATRIAAHVADVAKGSKSAQEWDKCMGQARKELDWEAQARLAIDPDLVTEIRGSKPSAETEACTMCGKFCAVKGIREYLSVSDD